MLCKSKVQNNFSKAANTYDTQSYVQEEAANTLVKHLRTYVKKDITSILDIGTGTGAVVQGLLPYFPSARYTLNDISPRMLEVAAQKLNDHKNIYYTIGDAEEIVFEPTDLTISNLTFQWFNNFEKSISALWEKTNILCFSIPCKGSFSEWKKILHELGSDSPLLHLQSQDELHAFLEKVRPAQFWYKTKTIKATLKDPAACLRYFQALGVNTSPKCCPVSSFRKILASTLSPFVLTYDLFFALLVK
jgi:malonyl-CoA O-methyltransferase